jgi:transcription elongation GreA/GreB family factor
MTDPAPQSTRPLSDASVEMLAAVATRFEDDPSVLKAISQELAARDSNRAQALYRELRRQIRAHEEVERLRRSLMQIDDAERLKVLREEFVIAEQILIRAQDRERGWKQAYTIQVGDRVTVEALDARGFRHFHITETPQGGPDIKPTDPVARLLLGREIGDVIHVPVSGSTIPARIVKIRKPGGTGLVHESR